MTADRHNEPGASAALNGDVDDLALDLARMLLAMVTPSGGADHAIEVLLNGVRYLLTRLPPEEAAAPTPPASGQLSPREAEVVRMVAAGYTNKTIALVLDISTWTVAAHLRRIFAKLGVSTRAAMVARANASGGLIPPADAPPPGARQAAERSTSARPPELRVAG